MISLVQISREILERIFFHSTALHNLIDSNKGSAYHNGEHLHSAEERKKAVSGSLQSRIANTQVCKRWRDVGLKFRFEFLVVDSKCSENWVHVNETMTKFAVGKFVKRLELDAFDSSATRVKAATHILKQCRNVEYVSLKFQDDTRRNVPVYEMMMSAIQQVDASSLKSLICDFGTSFEQALIIQKISKFPNLQSLSIHSAFGFGSVSIFDSIPLELAHLRSLDMATTKDALFRLMSEWDLPSLQDLSVFNLKSVKTFKKFFKSHGHKVRSLGVTYIQEDSDIWTLNDRCPNLEELVVSVDGIPFTLRDGIMCSLFHKSVKRIGVRDTCINMLTVDKTMAVLDGLMDMFTNQRRFPMAKEIRFLDFQRELWYNVPWRVHNIELWITWTESCEERMIDIQAADGKALSFADSSLRVLASKEEIQEGWLSIPYSRLI